MPQVSGVVVAARERARQAVALLVGDQSIEFVRRLRHQGGESAWDICAHGLTLLDEFLILIRLLLPAGPGIIQAVLAFDPFLALNDARGIVLQAALTGVDLGVLRPKMQALILAVDFDATPEASAIHVNARTSARCRARRSAPPAHRPSDS